MQMPRHWRLEAAWERALDTSSDCLRPPLLQPKVPPASLPSLYYFFLPSRPLLVRMKRFQWSYAGFPQPVWGWSPENLNESGDFRRLFSNQKSHSAVQTAAKIARVTNNALNVPAYYMFIWPLSSKTGLSNSFTHLFLLDTLFQELWWGKRWWLKACCSATASRLYMDAHSVVFNWETQWAFQAVLGARIRYWSKSDPQLHMQIFDKRSKSSFNHQYNNGFRVLSLDK